MKSQAGAQMITSFDTEIKNIKNSYGLKDDNKNKVKLTPREKQEKKFLKHLFKHHLMGEKNKDFRF